MKSWEPQESPINGDRPFTPEEREELRLIMERERGARFLWRTLRIWAGGLTAAGAALLTAWDHWNKAK